ncbi:hypothetical protein OCUBac02_09160 [Bosea sp. ANAM02]|nr:hypothetical protein OCUBac02_09160 [Bosea sp. ANAM02]
MALPKPISIATAERICKAHAADQVIIYARTVGEGCGEHVTTYGKDKVHCAAAARIGDAIGRQVVKPVEELLSRAVKAEQELSAHKAVHNIGLPQEGYRELVWREAHEFYEAGGFDLVAHLERQRAFSHKTFGPGARTKGVIDHIRKELAEIEAQPDDIEEWVDVIILAFDGAWRAGWEPAKIVEAITTKQKKNEARKWPDWRTADPEKAIEHLRHPIDQPDRNEGRSDVVVPDDIARILVDALGVDREKVTADARLSDDLGADSLDAIEILTNIEMERDISISDTEAEAIVTVGDLASIVQMKAA